MGKVKTIKNKGLLNPFSVKTRELFVDIYGCFGCGRSDRGLQAHHISKRISPSPYNLAPLCWVCHLEGNIHTPEIEQKYLRKTKEYLDKIGYIATLKDLEFLSREEIKEEEDK